MLSNALTYLLRQTSGYSVYGWLVYIVEWLFILLGGMHSHFNCGSFRRNREALCVCVCVCVYLECMCAPNNYYIIPGVLFCQNWYNHFNQNAYHTSISCISCYIHMHQFVKICITFLMHESSTARIYTNY